MKINLTFENIITDIRQLAINVNSSTTKYDAIIAIAGGGLIPARLIRNYLNIPIYTVNIKFYNNKHEKNELPEVVQWLSEREISKLNGKNILIVDDLDDTRGTLLHILYSLNKYSFRQIGVATLYNKKKGATTTCYAWKARQVTRNIAYIAQGYEKLILEASYILLKAD